MSALLLIFEIGVGAALVNSGKHHISASLAGITTLAAQLREYSRPLPKLGKYL